MVRWEGEWKVALDLLKFLARMEPSEKVVVGNRVFTLRELVEEAEKGTEEGVAILRALVTGMRYLKYRSGIGPEQVREILEWGERYIM